HQNSLARPLIDVGPHRVAQSIKYAATRMPNRLPRLLRFGILRYVVLAYDRVKVSFSANDNRKFIRYMRIPLYAGFAGFRLDMRCRNQSRTSISYFDHCKSGRGKREVES